jgi:hypothetical protein
MAYYLIEIHTNWADEMDIDGFEVKTEKEYNEWKEGWDKLQGRNIEMFVGNNEEVDVSFEDFDIKKISKEEYFILKKLNLLSFGYTSLIDAYEYDFNDDIE